MKNIVKIMTIVLGLSAAMPAIAAKDSGNRMSFGSNIAALNDKKLDMQYSVKVLRKLSVNVPFFLEGSWSGAKNLTALLGVGLTYNFTGNALDDGWYGQARMGLAFSQWAIAAVKADLQAGYGWYWDNGLMLQVGAGLLFPMYNKVSNWGFDVEPTGTLGVGYSW